MNRRPGGALEWRGVCLAVAGLAMVVACGPPAVPRSDQPLWQPPAAARLLVGRVRFTGIHFIIENQSDTMWRAVDVRVGRDGDPPPFRYQADAILGRRSLTIGALNFARPDDLRLDPFHYTPERWAVTATIDGEVAFAEGRLE